ncbi:hypothetical protein ACFO0U_05295 [Chromohalobacter sarecensis]|uniref:Uncharacterized protein n=1 Tax=Chromohalobacter sarecensis TaxID=245294 RepID=A0ABV9CY36_9GAMM|nr:hypothetical protein [Chromohalobacter sarecensis]MCK0713470.1 hypothetical protein [Chromohalobacter sarecensis]
MTSISVFKKAHLKRKTLSFEGGTFCVNRGAWAFYVPECQLKILHAVDSFVHCTHKSAPRRDALLKHNRGLKNGNYLLEDWQAAYRKPALLRVAENYIAARRLADHGLGPKVSGIALILNFSSFYSATPCLTGGIYTDNLANFPEKEPATLHDLNAVGVAPDKIQSCLRQQIRGYVSDLNSVVPVMPVNADAEVSALYQELQDIVLKNQGLIRHHTSLRRAAVQKFKAAFR